MTRLFDFIATLLYRLKNSLIDGARLYAIARQVNKLADFFDSLAVYGVKYTLLDLVWGVLMTLDSGEAYSGESAPYCGHAYSGFDNKYLSTSYHEGDGGGSTKFSILGYKLCYENVSGSKYYISK